MNAELETIREQQKATWNKFSAGWRKWDDFTMDWLRPMGEEIIRDLHIRPTDIVLDVAAGTGEPGLSIATLAKDGKVVITDLAEGMLAVARDKAADRGISNYETVACDVCELPFDDETFDAVSCRFGFMFFPDMLLAAREMHRVLKPGGRLAASVWGVPAQNAWITTIMGTIGRHLQLPAPPAGAPGMFRCAAPGFLTDLLRQAGFQDVHDTQITGQLRSSSKEAYWQFMNEVAAPVVAAMSQADAATQVNIRTEVFALIDEQCSDGSTALNYGTVVAYGQK
ncbi:class I SAM-dependent methyltransferase [Hymenobacter jeollabukensis]|uniref:Methyltransferase domain-containing protein n=1 Tax=Hymenobacter jeollabukensis TaxID=2025313 RepID=A0A5R8WNY7_9BACT|nr:class I SAM-dependent methyltransferase [Hymenobacter jeollabukensis]TLM91153.1 methyltransferase domain-containing protein [Hymenobacter jeollabukensis]